MRRAYKKFRNMYDRGPESVRVKRLTVYAKSVPVFPGDWTQITFNGLRALVLKAGSLDFSTECSEFIARHELLTYIILRDADHPRELAGFPRMSSFHNAVVAQDLGEYFRVDCVWLVRGEDALQIGDGANEELRVKKVKVCITTASTARIEDVISCVLGNLPPCAELSLMWASDYDAERIIVVRNIS